MSVVDKQRVRPYGHDIIFRIFGKGAEIEDGRIQINGGRTMSYYKICPSCGAHLDPGEQCSCEKKEKEETKMEDER